MSIFNFIFALIKKITVNSYSLRREDDLVCSMSYLLLTRHSSQDKYIDFREMEKKTLTGFAGKLHSTATGSRGWSRIQKGGGGGGYVTFFLI